MAGTAFRVLLLVVLLGTAYYAFLRKNRLPVHLVLVLALLGTGALLVVFPDLSNDVAHRFGLWRGADLVTYLLEVLLLFVVLHYAVRFSEVEANITVLARKIALLEAELREERARNTNAPRAPG